MSRLLPSLVLASLLSTSVLGAGSAAARGFAAAPPSAAPAWVGIDDAAPAARPELLTRARVRAALVTARSRNLRAFRAYRLRGVYPHNTMQPGALNVWRDAEGHLCAAATMIDRSGATALVDQVAREQNFIRLADVQDSALMDWILTSGLTQAEVVAIQEPFFEVEPGPVAPAPAPRIAADRQAEDRRLARRYRQVDRQLVRDRAASLERAVDALMARPALARRLLAG